MPRLDAILSLAMALPLAATLGACKADPPMTPPPSPDAGDGPDAGDADAGAGVCGADALFTGSYVDWDGNSTGPNNTLDTELSGGGEGFTITAPNGRVQMCLPGDASTTVDFVHPDYVPFTYVFAPETAATAFDMRGLTPVRADDLFIALGLTRDTLSAQVLVDVRMQAASAEAVGAPAVGARVLLDSASAGAFSEQDRGVFAAGDTVVGEALIFYANVAVDGGSTALTVTAPAGATCVGPSSLPLVAGAITATTVMCSMP
ncbi:hypothetical protein [Haliangium ochraceum]|uniref:Lipoprotein n=1 Tax=Haliangium ochraceum (strain DSM 14365 / JCM 11303 / SMP-2) TaxID=502025 RepID=D0LW82_HALO1|nr:hypothetical protein [Haliangium ochraceum]ACY16014.1 hypothetical protein Hoch_3512 [Haliangium ochraceum DSM 14365]